MPRVSRSSATSLDRTATSSVSFDAVPEEGDAAGSSDSLLEQLELEFTEKVGQMRELAERLALRLKSNFQSEMIKLPKTVRNMTMREFCIEYGGDVDEAMKQQAKRSRVEDAITMPPPPRPAADAKAAASRGGKAATAAAAAPAAPTALPTPGSAARGKRGRGAAPAEPAAIETPGARGGRSRVAATPGASAKGLTTPAGGSSQPAVAFTPRIHETPRLMKGGEVALSANGSPINVLNTVKARVSKRGRTSQSWSVAPAVVLAMVDGSEVDLSDGAALKALEADGDGKDYALSQLEELQKQVTAHIKALKGPYVPEI